MGKSTTLRRASRAERGEGKFKAILVTAVLAFMAYAAVKVVPPYVSEYQLADKMTETARFASVNRNTEEQIRNTIYKEMQELDIPAKKEDLKITAEGGRVSISLDYRVPIDLTVYQFELHFTPTTANKDII